MEHIITYSISAFVTGNLPRKKSPTRPALSKLIVLVSAFIVTFSLIIGVGSLQVDFPLKKGEEAEELPDFDAAYYVICWWGARKTHVGIRMLIVFKLPPCLRMLGTYQIKHT